MLIKLTLNELIYNNNDVINDYFNINIKFIIKLICCKINIILMMIKIFGNYMFSLRCSMFQVKNSL